MQQLELVRDLIMHQVPSAEATQDAEIAKKVDKES
jgi:hypothetical protein